MAPISSNAALIRERVRLAAQRAGRNPAAVSIVAVSKFHSVERIREAAAAGFRIFGESRQQEAQTKLPALKDLGEWHFIGNLQTNKAKGVAELFEVVESVDSPRLGEKLSSAAQELGKTLRVYAQVNISAEPQKHGFALEGAEQEILALGRLQGLSLEGLMGMAAASEDPEQARESFRALRSLRDRLAPNLKLSMGMSHDYEVAIEEGADLVRIGTALFA
jgi:pyridoxal phosphate enzyme (YggS family)